MGGREWAGWSGVKGGKWDKCNSIINKCIFLKIPKDLKIEKISELYDTQSFSHSSLGVNGSLGINWGAFKEANTSRKEVWLPNVLRFFLIATVWRG